MSKLPDDALVVRGGKNRPEDLARGTATHPSGVTGISVESAGMSVADLAKSIPHGQVGVTNVGDVPNTKAPVPVSSLSIPATPAESVMLDTTPVVVVTFMIPVEREESACSADKVPSAVCVM